MPGLGGGLEPLPLVADWEDGWRTNPWLLRKTAKLGNANIGWGPNQSSCYDQMMRVDAPTGITGGCCRFHSFVDAEERLGPQRGDSQ